MYSYADREYHDALMALDALQVAVEKLEDDTKAYVDSLEALKRVIEEAMACQNR